MKSSTFYHNVTTKRYKHPAHYTFMVGVWRDLGRLRAECRERANTHATETEECVRVADMLGVVQSRVARAVHREKGEA